MAQKQTSPKKLRPRVREKSISNKDLALQAIEAAFDQKARDLFACDLSKMSDITDYGIIVSGTSERHVASTAEKIKDKLTEIGERPLSVTGLEKGSWVILDYGSVVVHVFHEATRKFYNLEELWSKGHPIPLPEPLTKEALQLRTGMFPTTA